LQRTGTGLAKELLLNFVRSKRGLACEGAVLALANDQALTLREAIELLKTSGPTVGENVTPWTSLIAESFQPGNDELALGLLEEIAGGNFSRSIRAVALEQYLARSRAVSIGERERELGLPF
jgi:hypothetical protein